MVRLLRHRQTKGAATDRPNLRQPRHILTLPYSAVGLDLGVKQSDSPATDPGNVSLGVGSGRYAEPPETGTLRELSAVLAAA